MPPSPPFASTRNAAAVPELTSGTIPALAGKSTERTQSNRRSYTARLSGFETGPTACLTRGSALSRGSTSAANASGEGGPGALGGGGGRGRVRAGCRRHGDRRRQQPANCAGNTDKNARRHL